MKSYIINATSILKNKNNQDTIDLVAADLASISNKIPSIKQILLRGGGTADVIAGNEPNDIDLFYSYLIDGKETRKCVCQKIRRGIEKINFEYFENKEIDLENAFEKEPRLDPIKRTVGLFSFHTDYNSQFAIDKDGQIWTNTEALKYHTSGIYEVCYECCLPWGYFPHKGDSRNYWSFQVFLLIRGIGYITKRDLIPGEKFMRMFAEHKRLIKQGIKASGTSGFQKYAFSKIKTHKNFLTFLEKYVDRKEWNDTLKHFMPILENCK